jgi:hypothetical protein
MPLVSEESIAKFERHWATLIQHQQPVTFEVQFKSQWKYLVPSTGELLTGNRWFLVSAFPEFAEDGSFTKAWGCNVDVS